jgi:hypothetical protein
MCDIAIYLSTSPPLDPMRCGSFASRKAILLLARPPLRQVTATATNNNLNNEDDKKKRGTQGKWDRHPFFSLSLSLSLSLCLFVVRV